MSVPAMIDLTADNDGRRGFLATFTSELPVVRDAGDDVSISLSHATSPSQKRKRSEYSSAVGSVARNLPDPTLIDDLECRKSVNTNAIHLTKASTATSAPTPATNITRTKKARNGSTGTKTSPEVMAPTCGARLHESAEGCRPRNEPVDLTLEDSEEAIALINRVFPVSQSHGSRRASRLELLADPILIEDDDDNSPAHPSCDDRSSRHGFAKILTSDDSLSDRDLRRWLQNVQLDEEVREEAEATRRVELDIFRGNRFTCAPGKAVELEDGSFLRINKVTQDGRGQVFIEGLHLIRQNFVGLKMSNRKNELVWLQQGIKIDKLEHLEQHEVVMTQVRKNREIIFTNHTFPNISSRTDRDSLLDPLQDVELGPLFCRWKTTVIKGPKDGIVEESIEHLRYQDADDKVRCTNLGQVAYTRIADMRTRFNWRNIPNMPGGSHKVKQLVVGLDNEIKTAESQTYTFGDAFCGAGGTSRGALDAGLFIRWGFDIDEQAITSYHQNFGRGGTDCRHEAVHEFLQRARHDPPTVDVMHISPPCQPFSHAHTWDTNPARDEMNQAALFSVWHLVETMKPRAVTIEETDAIISRHNEWFSALINILVNLGYSVRWSTLKCQNYAVPQTRKRLFIIASG